MGQHPTEEELFSMISEVDENASGSIGMWDQDIAGIYEINQIYCRGFAWNITDFGEFLKVIEKQKERAKHFDDDSDFGMWIYTRMPAMIIIIQ